MNITEALVTILQNYRDEMHCMPSWFRNEWAHKTFHYVLKENKQTPPRVIYDLSFCPEESQEEANFDNASSINETLGKVALKVGIDPSQLIFINTR